MAPASVSTSAGRLLERLRWMHGVREVCDVIGFARRKVENCHQRDARIDAGHERHHQPPRRYHHATPVALRPSRNRAKSLTSSDVLLVPSSRFSCLVKAKGPACRRGLPFFCPRVFHWGPLTKTV